tara:strand:+ start:56 stop:526 length:471 start_codon:yes stop_codon:yes gene_type:complete
MHRRDSWSSEGSSSEEDENIGTAVIHSARNDTGLPYDKHQGFFLYNLAKLLDDAEELRVDFAIRWSTEATNALAINWPAFVGSYDEIKDVLVSYKMTRQKNKVRSARASWNRKLREWEFIMKPGPAPTWTTYTYKDDMFHSECDYMQLPVSRRQTL